MVEKYSMKTMNHEKNHKRKLQAIFFTFIRWYSKKLQVAPCTFPGIALSQRQQETATLWQKQTISWHL
jgi:hypothetical protein